MTRQTKMGDSNLTLKGEELKSRRQTFFSSCR